MKFYMKIFLKFYNTLGFCPQSFVSDCVYLIFAVIMCNILGTFGK